MIAGHDWNATKLGHIEGWPQQLRDALGICLHSSFPAAVYWGDDHHLFYNDAWLPIVDGSHPESLGRPARAAWPAGWRTFAPHIAHLREHCVGVSIREARPHATLDDDMVWDFSLSPLIEEDGRVVGILGQAQEASTRAHAARVEALTAAIDEIVARHSAPREILAAALPQVAAALGTNRVGLAEIDEGRGLSLVQHCWTDGSLPNLAGAHPFARFPALEAAIAERRDYVVEDAWAEPDAAEHVAIGVRARLAVPVIRRGETVAMLFAHDRAPRRWSAQKLALARIAAERIFVGTTRARARATLHDGDMRHRLIFEQTDAILFSADDAGRLTACNPAAARAFEHAAADLVMQPLAGLIGDDGYARLTAAIALARSTVGTAFAEVRVTRGGQQRDWEITATPATDRDGLADGFHAIARDITADRAAERRQRVLIDELNHRVKNMLALVQGLALQSFRDGRDTAASRAAFQGRLGALAAAHDLLTSRHWEGAAIAGIAEATLPAGSVRIAIYGPTLTIQPKAAISLALAFHELATNAATHGALSTPDGTVSVSWQVIGDRLQLVWHESGGPPVTVPPRPGVGLRVIERVLASDFQGRVGIDFAADGFVCTLDAPLPEALPRPDFA